MTQGAKTTTPVDRAELLRWLHAEYGDALFALALRLGRGDRQWAEDLVQETFLRAWQHPPKLYPGRGPAKAWLYTTARRIAIDDWRRRSARVGEVYTETMPELPTADHADRAVESWLVTEALSRLSPAHREVLFECFYRGRSVAEAARRLGVPPGTVKSRTHYALSCLRAELAAVGFAY